MKYGQDCCNVGDEGGFAPAVQDNSEALDVLMEAIEQSGHAGKVKIGTDVAASEFYDAGTKLYDLDFKNPSGSSDTMKKTSDQLADAYKKFKADLEGNAGNMQIVGDDLLVTNPQRIKK